MTDPIIRAPWTSEQVAALNAFQQRGGMHPFTCGRDHHPVSVVLMAHPDGWRCSDPACDYQQDWAHAFMIERAAALPAVVEPPADRAALRQRIAEALRPGSRDRSGHYPEGLMRDVDAVLAVLPADTDRTAVLRDAVAALDAHLESFFREWPEERQNSPWVNGWKDATAELRQMADEPATEAHLTPSGNVRVDHLLRSTDQPAAGARQDGAQDRG